MNLGVRCAETLYNMRIEMVSEKHVATEKTMGVASSIFGGKSNPKNSKQIMEVLYRGIV